MYLYHTGPQKRQLNMPVVTASLLYFFERMTVSTPPYSKGRALSISAVRFSALPVRPAAGFSRFIERTALYLIAWIGTGCFHNETASPAYQPPDFFSACGTFPDGGIGHALLFFKIQAAAAAFIFICWHTIFPLACSF
jgi:hypothetical protein